MIKLAAIMAPPLRVHVNAADVDRLAELESVVVASGHQLAAIDTADVVLSDGDCTATRLPIVAVGAADDDHAGLLPTRATAAQIDAALRAAAVGLVVRLSESEAFGELPESSPRTLLTPRETEVLSIVADGLSNKEIARRLDISLHTVKFHIESLLRKLGARSRAEAVAKGLARRRDESVDL